MRWETTTLPQALDFLRYLEISLQYSEISVGDGQIVVVAHALCDVIQLFKDAIEAESVDLRNGSGTPIAVGAGKGAAAVGLDDRRISIANEWIEPATQMRRRNGVEIASPLSTCPVNTHTLMIIRYIPLSGKAHKELGKLPFFTADLHPSFLLLQDHFVAQ